MLPFFMPCWMVNWSATERVAPDAPVREALRKMREARLSLLPVVEEGRVIGIVTLSGILRGASLLAGAGDSA